MIVTKWDVYPNLWHNDESHGAGSVFSRTLAFVVLCFVYESAKRATGLIQVCYCKRYITMTLCMYNIIGEGYPRTLPGKVDHLQKELSGCAVQIQALSTQLKAQDKDMSALREEFRLILPELGQTKRAIKDVTELLKT